MVKSFENANKVFAAINNLDLVKDTPKKDLMWKLLKQIKKKDELEMTKIIDKIPRSDITNWIWKLNKYHIMKYPYTKVAISKLKWRRGF